MSRITAAATATLLTGLLVGGAIVVVVSGRFFPAPPAPSLFREASGSQAAAARVDIPDRALGPLIERLSETEGYFDTDNFISNETSYQHVVPRLEDRVSPGGAYLGVGPEQNFTYILHSDPSIAIVVDIRRQNMLQHLLLKILIQESRGRADYVCALFARDCGSNQWDEDADIETVLDDVAGMRVDTRFLTENLERILTILVETYRVDLTEDDRERIAYVYRSFARAGPALRFSSFGGNSVVYPTFTRLATETDSNRRRAGYLASESLFAELRAFQQSNLLIPIVGDFAGDRALGAAADYLEEIDVPVSAVYTSNVEYYLFGTPGWDAWVSNVAGFRFTPDAVFLRAYFPTFGRTHPENVPGYRPTTLIQSIRGFLEDASAGLHLSYWDVVTRHRF